MHTLTIDNIMPEMLLWATQRAGYSQEKAERVFAPLAAWITGERKPTMRQLQQFADKFYVPIGYLFLNEPPKESLPFTLFRGKADINCPFDLNVYDTVMTVKGRQDWLEEYMEENDILPCPFAGKASISMPVAQTVAIIRTGLALDERWALSLKSVEVAVGCLTQKMEDAGVFVAFNGVVGNNTRRAIRVDECRGFALNSQSAPYVFINSADSRTAQMFTLIHELAHITIGLSAGHGGEPEEYNEPQEKYCDAVAAEFLVPKSVLVNMWDNDVKNMAKRFKVSEPVVARRAHDLALMTDEDYSQFWRRYRARGVAEKKRSAGGDFYRTSVRRVGRLFAIYVRNAVSNRQLSYTEAYRLTGLSGNTYDRFMKEQI